MQCSVMKRNGGNSQQCQIQEDSVKFENRNDYQREKQWVYETRQRMENVGRRNELFLLPPTTADLIIKH